jgi:ketosteroid isomerase-like protein
VLAGSQDALSREVVWADTQGFRRRAILISVPTANVEALRRGYEALNRGELSEVRALLHPDLVWQEDPASPEAGAHQGSASFERFLRSWLESFDDFRIEPEEIIEDGDRLLPESRAGIRV